MRNSPRFWASKCGKTDRAPPAKERRKSIETQRLQGFSNGRGRRARSCFATPLAVPEKIFGLPPLLDFFDRCANPLLAVSAAGGARRRCPARGFGAAVEKMEHQANPPLLQPFGRTQRRVDALLMLLYFGTPAGQLPGSLFFTITTAATVAGKTLLPN